MRKTDDDLREEVARGIERAGGVRAFARQIGVEPAYISAIMHYRSTLGPKVANALGYEEDGKRWVKSKRETGCG